MHGYVIPTVGRGYGYVWVWVIEIRYDKTLSLARSTSALLLQPGLDVLHNHDDIMIAYSRTPSYLLSLDKRLYVW